MRAEFYYIQSTFVKGGNAAFAIYKYITEKVKVKREIFIGTAPHQPA